ncbi:MAG: trypsin-like peptidase domain-containing protein [Deltaproteobacteria bacterium]|nr:trypsin-like peptidase domain-containing protein [Deltaproteobacteria bacterium]
MRTMPLAACATLLTVTGLGLVGCDDAEMDEGGRGGTPRILYGDDNRVEAEDAKDAEGVAIPSDGVVAVLYSDALQEGQNGEVSFKNPVSTFTTVYYGDPVCEDEPFYGQPNPPWCTAFLIAPNLVATAGHCVSSYECPDLSFLFGFQTESGVPKTSFDANDHYLCGTVLADQQTGAGSDWAIVQLDRDVVGYAPFQIRTADSVSLGDPLYVLGHPSGLPKKFTDDTVVRTNGSEEPFISLDGDTYGGNSGSPVFGLDNLVEGILVRGWTDFVWDDVDECYQSNWCPNDPGCPGWEEATRITELQQYFDCPEDALDEPNNTQATAALIVEGGYPNLFVCNDDWYEVDVLAGDTLTASIDFTHADGDIDVEIWDIGYIDGSAGTSDSEQVSVVSDIDQTLFVYVFGYSGAMGAYGMNITVSTGTTTCTSDDGYEDNDTQGTATSSLDLVPDLDNPDRFSGLKVCTGDDDWYVFVVDPWDTLTATIDDFSHANGDLDLKLYDANGIVDQSASVTGSETVWYTNPAGGSMWVQVYGYEGAENQYALEVTVEAAPECSNVAYEPNDTQGTAYLLDPEPPYPTSYPDLEVCTGDEDWYSVDLGENEKLIAEILFIHFDGGDLDLELHGADGVESSTSTSDDERAEYAPAGGGIVDIRVFGFLDSTNTYTMNLTVADTAPVISVTSTRYQRRKDKLSVKFTTDELATGKLCESGNPGNCRESSLGYSHRITLTTENSPALLTATNLSGIPSAPIEIEF